MTVRLSNPNYRPLHVVTRLSFALKRDDQSASCDWRSARSIHRMNSNVFEFET